MHEVTIEEAQGQLPTLIDELSHGEEVVIVKNGKPAAKLVAVADKRPGFGSMKGQIAISDDFDAPLDDFKDYA